MHLYSASLLLALAAPLTFAAAGCEPPDASAEVPGGAATDGSGLSSEGTSSGAISASLTDEQVAWLVHMREEEKLARDVYLTLGERWDVNVFHNIPRAEQRHMDAVGTLLQHYGLDDPIRPGAEGVVGVFTSAELSSLYDELVAQGQDSLGDALRVGAAIEELDIDDLNEALAALPGGLPADIAQVYENLNRGSRNHLRAFVGQLRARGEAYEPSYLSAETVEQILAEPTERGGRGRR